jgi:hypothetical protein
MPAQFDQENKLYMLTRKHTKPNRQCIVTDVQDSIPANQGIRLHPNRCMRYVLLEFAPSELWQGEFRISDPEVSNPSAEKSSCFSTDFIAAILFDLI